MNQRGDENELPSGKGLSSNLFSTFQQGIDIIESENTTSLQQYANYAQEVVNVLSITPFGAVAAAPVGALLEIIAAANADSPDVATADVLAATTDVVAFIGGVALLAAAPEASAVAAAAIVAGVGLGIVSAVLDGQNLGSALGQVSGAVSGILNSDVTSDITGLDPVLDISPFLTGGAVSDAAYASAIAAEFGTSMTDPIIMDLTGGGVTLTPLTGSTAYFDLHDSGFSVKTGWVGPGSGLLVKANNGNGHIDNISELFGSQLEDGFTALEALDANHDGVVNSSDPGYGSLEIWADTNGNGATDPGELQTLEQLGITSINLSATTVEQSIGGNAIKEIATAY